LSQRRIELGSTILSFHSHEEVTRYLRDLSEYFQKESERYGDKLGNMLRGPGQPPSSSKEAKDNKKDEKKPDQKRPPPGGWVKMGTMLVNTTTADSAITEVMYQVLEDLKLKLARTTEALKSFEQNANTLIPQGSTFEIYVKNGVPERIVAKAGEAKKATFNFDGRFRIV
jgi:hypothetical protein